MKTDFTEGELKAAYEICLLVQDHCANVLASGEGQKTSDKQWHRTATKFIKAYESINAYKLAKQGKAGSLGKALLLIGDMSTQLKKIKP